MYAVLERTIASLAERIHEAEDHLSVPVLVGDPFVLQRWDDKAGWMTYTGMDKGNVIFEGPMRINDLYPVPCFSPKSAERNVEILSEQFPGTKFRAYRRDEIIRARLDANRDALKTLTRALRNLKAADPS
jgi:hypothetical protein